MNERHRVLSILKLHVQEASRNSPWCCAHNRELLKLSVFQFT